MSLTSAALAGQQGRDPGGRELASSMADCRPGLGQLAQPGEPGRVAGVGHDEAR